ncbi:MAG: hypothetical protein CMK54_04895 [Proteobacteria bacterium]|nr:hypothetical protein [Pseudomonadota bacterium]
MFKSVNLWLLFLLLATPFTLWGKSSAWVLVKRDTDSLYYVDHGSVRPSKDKFVVKVLVKLNSSIFDNASFLFSQKVNCKNNKNKIIRYMAFPSKNTAYGNNSQRLRITPLPNYVFSTAFTKKVCKQILAKKLDAE